MTDKQFKDFGVASGFKTTTIIAIGGAPDVVAEAITTIQEIYPHFRPPYDPDTSAIYGSMLGSDGCPGIEDETNLKYLLGFDPLLQWQARIVLRLMSKLYPVNVYQEIFEHGTMDCEFLTIKKGDVVASEVNFNSVTVTKS